MNKFTKHVPLALVLFVFALCAGCGSHRHMQQLETQQQESIQWNADIQRESAAQSVLSSVGKTDRSSYRITWTFDTSLPQDPETHLPPLQSIQVEGEEQTEEQSSTSENVSGQTEDIQVSGHAEGEAHVSASDDRDTEVGNRLGRMLEYLIPLFLLPVALYFVYRGVRKNSSK